MQELISKDFNWGSRAGCGEKLRSGHSPRHQAPPWGQGHVGISGHSLGSGPGPVRQTRVRHSSGMAQQGRRDGNGLCGPMAEWGRAVAELETSILQHCCRISQYLNLNLAAYTQGYCDRGVAMEHVSYLQSASRCDIGPTVDKQMETRSNCLKYQVPLRNCVWAPAESF